MSSLHSSESPARSAFTRRLVLPAFIALGLWAGKASAQTALVQINCGGGAVAPFAADTDFNTGNEFSSGASISTGGIANPAPTAVYQSVRWNSSFAYTIPGLTTGTAYTVRLHFVELTWTAAGQRVFNVAINGTTVLSNFDIFAQVGQNHALVEPFTATANASGQIVISFTQGPADNPSVAGLEILSEGPPATPSGLTATGNNGSVTLGWGASSGATSYNVYRGTTSGGEGSTAYASGLTGTSYTDSAVTNGATYYYTVAAVNAQGMSSQSAQASATPSSGGTGGIPIQIDCGSASAASPFVADTDYNAGNEFSSGASISTTGVANAAPAAVYQTVRWAPSFAYTLPGLTAGTTYTVRLHFVELTWTAAGQRVFNVAINGTNVLSNFDIFAQVGQNHALVEPFTATANASGQIVVSFTQGSADNPSIAGIEVLAASQGGPPPAPTGLQATPGNGSVALGWAASSGATSYNVYRSTTSGGEGGTAYASGVTGTSYTDSSVVNGTTYYYTVAAVNAQGTSSQSAQASATPSGGGSGTPNSPLIQIDCGSPTAVAPFAADTDFNTGNEFSSSASISTTGVANAAPAAVYQTVRWASAFSYTLPGLTAGTSYVVRLHFVELTWTAAGQRKFNVAINGTNVLSNFDIYAQAGQNRALMEQFNATANASGQIVVAFSQGAADNPSLAGIEVWTQPPVPGAPSGLQATGGNGQVALSWTAGASAATYNVYRGTSSGGESGASLASGIAATALTDSTVSNGTTYFYTVVSVNSAGASGPSNEASATPHVVAPPAPANVTATAGFGSVTVSWNASQGATSYLVYRGTSPGGEGSTAYATNITGTSFTDGNVAAGTTYYYRIVAVNSAGDSVESSETTGVAPLSTNGQGANMPYTRYRAADSTVASYGGGATVQASPSFDKMNLATQASNQAYVQLSNSGSYVSFTVGQSGANGVTMRFTLPDTSNGMGQNGSVACYVNGSFVKTINLTSYYAWQYFSGGGDPSDSPNGGVPAFAFDEVHWTLPTALNSGDVISIRSTGGPVVGVDFLELESVPAALAQPAGSVSVASYGAVAYGDNSAAYSEIAELQGGASVTTAPGVTDSLPAFNAAVAAALASPNKTLYIPPGTYYLSSMWVIGSTSSPISQLNIVGAGIWYTNLQFTNPNVSGGGCSIRLAASGTMNFSNVYLNSMLRSRYNENAIYKCFMDNFGVNSNFHDLWEDHFECGYWVADYAYNPCQVASNLTIQNCRIRNNLADGVNFCNGTSNSTVTNCSIRNGGDDGLAVWPNNYNGAPMAVNDTFTHDTIEFEWRSAGIALYGGSGHQVTNDLVEDTFMSAGFRSNTTFPGYQFQNNTGITISNDTFIGCGTSYDAWAGELGAVDLEASNEPIQNFTFSNIAVIDAQRDGYSFGFSGGMSGLQFNTCAVNGTGLDGITTSKYTVAHLGAGIETYGAGSATFKGFTWANCAGGNVQNGGGFVLTFQ